MAYAGFEPQVAQEVGRVVYYEENMVVSLCLADLYGSAMHWSHTPVVQ